MQRISFKVESQPVNYKEFCHSHFNGFNNDYPSYLCDIIDQRQFIEIINNINNNSIRKLDTPKLKALLVSSGVLSYLFIGLPVFVGALIGNKVIYKKHNKKLSKDINQILSEVNKNPIILEKNIEFCLVEKQKMKRVFEYSIEVRYWVTNVQKLQIERQRNIQSQQQIERSIQQQNEIARRNNSNTARSLTRNNIIVPPTTSTTLPPLPHTPKEIVDIPIDLDGNTQ